MVKIHVYSVERFTTYTTFFFVPVKGIPSIKLKQMLKRSEITAEELESIRYIIKDASLRIKIEPPDVQWSILKKFVQSIRLNKKTNNYKMVLVGRRLSELDSEVAPILLERSCYFANPHGTYNSTVDKASKNLPNS